MSNIFDPHLHFFPVTKHLIHSGHLATLRDGALRLYLVLLYLGQEQTRVELELSNQEIRRLAGLSPNTIRRARTEMSEAGLVQLKFSTGGKYAYVLMNPETGNPMRRRTRARSPNWSEIGNS